MHIYVSKVDRIREKENKMRQKIKVIAAGNNCIK